MKRINSLLIVTIILAVIVLAIVGPQPCPAATANPSPASTGYETWHFYVQTALTATATPIKFKVPFPYRVVAISAYAAAIDRTTGDETYTVDVLQASTSLLSSAKSILAADTIYEATLASTSPSIPDEATVSIVFTLGGTTPILTGTTVEITVKRQ